jgi:hypothetical protein
LAVVIDSTFLVESHFGLEGIYDERIAMSRAYHLFLILNPDRGFELAPDPEEKILKQMHQVLIRIGSANKTPFLEACKTPTVGEKKLRRLFDIGQGRYWDVQDLKEKNAKLVTPILFGSSAPIYNSDELPDCSNSSENAGPNPLRGDSPKSLGNPQFGSFPEACSHSANPDFGPGDTGIL